MMIDNDINFDNEEFEEITSVKNISTIHDIIREYSLGSSSYELDLELNIKPKNEEEKKRILENEENKEIIQTIKELLLQIRNRKEKLQSLRKSNNINVKKIYIFNSFII